MSKKHRLYGIPDASELKLSIAELLEPGAVIFDNHAHIDMTVRHQKYDQREHELKLQEISNIIANSAKIGIRGFVHCACELDDIKSISRVLDEISATSPEVIAIGAAAIHPNEAVLHQAGKGEQTELLEVAADGLEPPELKPRHLEFDLEEALAVVEGVIRSDPRVKIVGETGLDYFRSASVAKTVQKLSFRKHIELAKSLGLALQIHDRDSHQDVIDILLQDSAPEVTLFHSFSGDREMAETCCNNGWYMAFSGPVTFKPNDSLREALKFVWNTRPDLLLVETDSPFLAPHPWRGRTNSPALIPEILLQCANFLEVSPETYVNQIAQNQARILH